jgi:hypothetical protein
MSNTYTCALCKYLCVKYDEYPCSECDEISATQKVNKYEKFEVKLWNQ